MRPPFSFADFFIFVASDLSLTIFYASLCLNGPGVISGRLLPGYRSSSIAVCSVGVLLCSILNL